MITYFNNPIELNLNNKKISYSKNQVSFVLKEFFEIIEYFVEHDHAKNVTLRINTNLTNIKEHFLNLISEFKEVALLGSIDGYDKQNDFLIYFKFKSIAVWVFLCDGYKRNGPTSRIKIIRIVDIVTNNIYCSI